MNAAPRTRTRPLPVGLVTHVHRVILFGILGGLFAAAAAADQPSAPAWGTGNQSMYIAHVFDMVTPSSDITWAMDTNHGEYLYGTSASFGGGRFYGGIQVPRGARILRIELEACDFSPTGVAYAVLAKTGTGTAAPITNVQTGATAAETPGCARFSKDLPTPEEVDTTAFRYSVSVTNTTTDGMTSLGAVRVLYELQVSPAPATATFLDVPTTDPAFRDIEALYSSGVTAGCGGGNYCPNSPLTRRQMAVFLSRLLGLNWPESVAP